MSGAIESTKYGKRDMIIKRFFDIGVLDQAHPLRYLATIYIYSQLIF